MDQKHKEILENDLKEAKNFGHRFLVNAKLFYYLFQRPIANFLLKKFFKKYLAEDLFFNQIDKFLWDEGGMFKSYVYKICDKFYPLKNSVILVPGIGYGRNLFQLAAFKPKIIIAFDLYPYEDEWKFLIKSIKEIFGVEVKFFNGDFDIVPKEFKNSFDFIISDAVLEHVKNLPQFLEDSKKFLKKDGIFYASFGPIWYGPGGDHIDWGEKNLFNHLLLDKATYQKNVEARIKTVPEDSCEGFFMFKEDLFSYLKIDDYFRIFSEKNFKKELIFAKISSRAISLLKNALQIRQQLDEKKYPKFDRYCSGFYVWMKN